MSLIIFPNGKEWVYTGSIPKGWRVKRSETVRGGFRHLHVVPWRRAWIAHAVALFMRWLDDKPRDAGPTMS